MNAAYVGEAGSCNNPELCCDEPYLLCVDMLFKIAAESQGFSAVEMKSLPSDFRAKGVRKDV